jgi:nucleoside-diphosphate-sugar epimerase
VGESLRVVEGDIRDSGFGLAAGAQRELARGVEEIWHCAASFKFEERDREKIVAHNVVGTRNLLDFACLCNQGKEAPVFYVSTAYAAPVSLGIAREELPPEGTLFRNLYEWSKQEAERLVNRFRRESQLPAVILRPTVILGHSLTGKAALRGITGARETTSILFTLHQIARESFKKKLPGTDQEVEAAFFLIENHLAPSIQRQLYFPGGIRISVSHGMEDSVELGDFCEEVLALACREFPDLIVADCLLNTFCFLPLITSHFLPVQQLGWMMGVMLVACAVGALIFMVALLPQCVVGRKEIP